MTKIGQYGSGSSIGLQIGEVNLVWETEDWGLRRQDPIDREQTSASFETSGLQDLNLREWKRILLRGERLWENIPRTLRSKRFNLNLNKHALINDQKPESTQTLRILLQSQSAAPAGQTLWSSLGGGAYSSFIMFLLGLIATLNSEQKELKLSENRREEAEERPGLQTRLQTSVTF